MRGRFVTFEGIDGSGKTTVVHRIEPELRRRGVKVTLTSEPTRTWLGDAVRKSYQDDVGPLAETFLFLADRARHTEVIRTWVAAGSIVVSDRYADSTYAYQGARLMGVVKDPIRWLQRVSAPVVLEPDLTILLEVPARLGLRRIADRKRKVRFEKEGFLTKVAKNYDRLARSPRFVRIDGARPAAD
ncbi:MAG TPA: dTMP kinase, partial [Thermoplasmata archaeon]|nr:dTMP kinase [Thermoplasmata archaeon]